MKNRESLENQLAFQLYACGFEPPEREYRFCTSRKWRSDFAWPDKRLLVEVEGGIWNKGRHVRGYGFENDCEKYNEAILQGFIVIRVTQKHIQNGKALQWIESFLKKT